jgi:hypothetical protein
MSIENITGNNFHAHVGSHPRHSSWEHGKPLAEAAVGQEVSLRIVNKIADGRYLAAMGDSRYVVESTMQFTVGQTVKATVSAVGGVVELKYLGSGQFELIDATAAEPQKDDDRPVSAALGKLQSKFKMTLPVADRQLVEDISAKVPFPETMAIGGLYLNKLGVSIDDDALHALYAKQVWSDLKVDDSAMTADISALVRGVQQGNDSDIVALAKLLGDAVEQSAPMTTSNAQEVLPQAMLLAGSQLAQYEKQDADSGDAGDGAASLKELARRLLNTQDSGAIAYHYGSLPVLIADQLIELDVLMFREREVAGRSQGLKKLVMTLKTETLGRVEIVAQSIDSNVSVSIATQSPQATELLAGHAQEVRELVGRLGWNVDSVAYRLATDPARAAEQVVRHVLNSGTLDAVV